MENANAYSFLNTGVYEKLNQLQADTLPEWGQMSAQQMVEHLSMIPNLCNGTVTDMVVYGTPEQIEKRRWHTFVNKTPFPKGIRVPVLPENPLPLTYSSIPEAIEAFREATAKFYTYYKASPDALFNHPILGPLNFEEWEYFQMIHALHHLEQFRLL